MNGLQNRLFLTLLFFSATLHVGTLLLVPPPELIDNRATATMEIAMAATASTAPSSDQVPNLKKETDAGGGSGQGRDTKPQGPEDVERGPAPPPKAIAARHLEKRQPRRNLSPQHSKRVYPEHRGQKRLQISAKDQQQSTERKSPKENSLKKESSFIAENQKGAGKKGARQTKGSKQSESNPSQGMRQREYLQAIVRRIERNKHYPYKGRINRIEGKSRVGFHVFDDGGISPPEIAASSGQPSLDAAARQAVMDAAPFPEPPPEFTRMPIAMEVILVFDLRR